MSQINQFNYKIQNIQKNKNISNLISEEINRGLSFIISQYSEEIIPLSGTSKNWAIVTVDGNDLNIEIDNDYFVDQCIIEQIITSLWANLLDFGEIRLEEFCLSRDIHHSLISNYGSNIKYKQLLPNNGPYFGLIYKPSFSLTLENKINIARRFASLGGSFIKEDETYFVSKTELLNTSEKIQNVMNETSDNCYYVPNITPFTTDDEIFKQLYSIGIKVSMFNFLISGLPTIQKIRKNNKLFFWGHRVGYKALDSYISMRALAILASYSGIDFLHIGTPFLAIKETIDEKKRILNAMRNVNNYTIPIFTKTSIQSPEILTESFGNEIIIVANGSLRTNGSLDWKKFEEWMGVLKNE